MMNPMVWIFGFWLNVYSAPGVVWLDGPYQDMAACQAQASEWQRQGIQVGECWKGTVGR